MNEQKNLCKREEEEKKRKRNRRPQTMGRICGSGVSHVGNAEKSVYRRIVEELGQRLDNEVPLCLYGYIGFFTMAKNRS